MLCQDDPEIGDKLEAQKYYRSSANKFLITPDMGKTRPERPFRTADQSLLPGALP